MKLNLPHILIVDDDKRILQLVNDYLIKNNFRVSTAANALVAREKIENIEFDLIVLDIMMPGESGLKLTNSLKKNNFKTPILLLSALGSTGDRIKGLEIGASDYLTKPFEPKELLLRMNNLILLREKIQALSKFHQLEVLRILQKHKVNYTENRNGIFINMNNLSDASLDALQEYLKYVSTQQNQLDVVENKKKEYANSFFKNNKEISLT